MPLQHGPAALFSELRVVIRATLLSKGLAALLANLLIVLWAVPLSRAAPASAACLSDRYYVRGTLVRLRRAGMVVVRGWFKLIGWHQALLGSALDSSSGCRRAEMWQLACEHRCPSRSLLRSLPLGFLPRPVALAQMRLPHAFNRFRAGPVPNRRATSPRELLGLAVSKGVLALAQPARVLRWGRFAQVECGTPRMYGGAVT